MAALPESLRVNVRAVEAQIGAMLELGPSNGQAIGGSKWTRPISARMPLAWVF